MILRDLSLHGVERLSARPARALLCREEIEALFPTLRGYRGTVQLEVSARPIARRTAHRAELHLSESWARVWAWGRVPRDVEISVALCDELLKEFEDLQTCWFSVEATSV